MGKILNCMKIFEYTDMQDLYMQMDKYLMSNCGGDYSYCYTVKQVQILDGNHAAVYFEQEFNRLYVKFIYNREEIYLEECIYNPSLYSIEEIHLMNELGCVQIGGREYDIEDVKYVISPTGTRYVEIYLS